MEVRGDLNQGERIKGRERMDEIRDKKLLPYYSILLFK
jgi:hypothetical protein